MGVIAGRSPSKVKSDPQEVRLHDEKGSEDKTSRGREGEWVPPKKKGTSQREAQKKEVGPVEGVWVVEQKSNLKSRLQDRKRHERENKSRDVGRGCAFGGK